MTNFPKLRISEIEDDAPYRVEQVCQILGWKSVNTYLRNAAKGRVPAPKKIGTRRYVMGAQIREILAA